MCYNGVVILRKQTRKAFSATSSIFMGMTHDINRLSTTIRQPEAMTPERLANVLGLKRNTLYKAWKANNLNGWAVSEPLKQADVDTMILYYAGRGNETARKLAENARMRLLAAAEKAPALNEIAEAKPEAPAENGKESRAARPSRWYYLADLILLFVLGVSGYELHFFLGMWGLFFWGVYAAAVILSLIMAKDRTIPRTAEAGFTAVCILEALAFFGHFAMANLLVVNAAKADLLPFRYEAWGTLSAPFYIAAVLACILSGIVIYVVWIRLNITKELNKNAEQ